MFTLATISDFVLECWNKNSSVIQFVCNSKLNWAVSPRFPAHVSYNLFTRMWAKFIQLEMVLNYVKVQQVLHIKWQCLLDFKKNQDEHCIQYLAPVPYGPVSVIASRPCWSYTLVNSCWLISIWWMRVTCFIGSGWVPMHKWRHY